LLHKALISVTASIALACGRSHEIPADAAKSSATTAHAPDAKPPAPVRNHPASIVGDTFVLVAIGDQSTRVPVSDSAPCGFLPYMRLVIANETHFYHVEDNQPTCFGPATDSASRESGVWSTYRLNRDTLHLFQGDGSESFFWVDGILSADSLIEPSGDRPRRFVRIRPTSTSKRR
jgi:hypothetical protein